MSWTLFWKCGPDLRPLGGARKASRRKRGSRPHVTHEDGPSVLLIFDLSRDDLVGISHGAVLALRALFQRIDRFHAGNDLAEDGVLTIEEGSVGIGDEELRVERVRVAGACGADHATLEALGIELRFDIRKIRTTRAGAAEVVVRRIRLAICNVARLGHEA